MAKETINNKASGETGGTARTKLNAMFTELYAYMASSTSAIALKLTKKTVPISAGSNKTKVSYDADGLITSGTDATTADIADSADKRYCTDAQKVVIGNTTNTNSGDNAVNSLYSGLLSMATGFIKGRVSVGSGVPEDLTPTQVRTLINVADGSTANTKASIGDINTGTDDTKFLTSLAAEGSRLVKGPSSALAREQLCCFNSTNVNLIKESKIYRVDDNYGVGSINPLSLFEVGGSFGLKSRILDGSDTLDATDCIVICSVNSITVSLPEASTCTGRVYIIKGNKDTTTRTDEITISAFGSEKIDEGLEYTLASAYACVTIYATTSGWIILSEKI